MFPFGKTFSCHADYNVEDLLAPRPGIPPGHPISVDDRVLNPGSPARQAGILDQTIRPGLDGG